MTDAETIEGPLWVFAYGSLIWKPGFAPVQTEIARLAGFQRSFCMDSVVYRGTPEAPGLVLALDRAPGHCEGLAYRVAETEASHVLGYLRERELVSAAYKEHWLDVDLRDGPSVRAVTYVIDRDHSQYCGQMSLEEQALRIARAHGQAGPNDEYLHNTRKALRDWNLPDPHLDDLAERVVQITGRGG